MPTSGQRRPDARHDVGPLSAASRPDLGRASCMSACTENQSRPYRFRTDVGPILLADLGPICKSGLTSARYFPTVTPAHRVAKWSGCGQKSEKSSFAKRFLKFMKHFRILHSTVEHYTYMFCEESVSCTAS